MWNGLHILAFQNHGLPRRRRTVQFTHISTLHCRSRRFPRPANLRVHSADLDGQLRPFEKPQVPDKVAADYTILGNGPSFFDEDLDDVDQPDPNLLIEPDFSCDYAFHSTCGP